MVDKEKFKDQIIKALYIAGDYYCDNESLLSDLEAHADLKYVDRDTCANVLRMLCLHGVAYRRFMSLMSFLISQVDASLVEGYTTIMVHGIDTTLNNLAHNLEQSGATVRGMNACYRLVAEGDTPYSGQVFSAHPDTTAEDFSFFLELLYPDALIEIVHVLPLVAERAPDNTMSVSLVLKPPSPRG